MRRHVSWRALWEMRADLFVCLITGWCGVTSLGPCRVNDALRRLHLKVPQRPKNYFSWRFLRHLKLFHNCLSCFWLCLNAEEFPSTIAMFLSFSTIGSEFLLKGHDGQLFLACTHWRSHENIMILPFEASITEADTTIVFSTLRT